MKGKFIKLSALCIACLSTIAILPLAANAEWKNEGDGNRFFILEDGKKATGWQIVDDDWYYFDTNGVLQKNTNIEGYDLDSNGLITDESLEKMNEKLKDEIEKDKQKDHSNDGFNIVEGERKRDPLWKKVDDKWTLYDENGNQIKNKWYPKDYNWLHFNEEGYLDTSTIVDGYELDKKGWIKKEPGVTKDSSDSYKEKSFLWEKENDDWYLYDSEGEIIKNDWEMNNGIWYCFDANGKMLRNTTIKDYQKNDCVLDANGALTNREKPDTEENTWKSENGKDYIYDKDGKKRTSWVMYYGKWYFLDSNGVVKKNITVIDKGEKYILGADGAWIQ